MRLSPVPMQPTVMPFIPEDRPVYRIKAGTTFYGPDDTLYPEETILAWHDQPSYNSMEPLNELARQEMLKLVRKLDIEGKKVAEKNGTAYIGLENAMLAAEESAKQDGRRVEVFTSVAKTPVFGKPKRSSKKKIEKIENKVGKAAPILSPVRGQMIEDDDIGPALPMDPIEE